MWPTFAAFVEASQKPPACFHLYLVGQTAGWPAVVTKETEKMHMELS